MIRKLIFKQDRPYHYWLPKSGVKKWWGTKWNEDSFYQRIYIWPYYDETYLV